MDTQRNILAKFSATMLEIRIHKDALTISVDSVGITH